jgi:ATP-dependent phosphofructokinase / diphosphate-dependent phosphofructokinase
MAKRIGILTGGGDAPGLNAVIRAAVITARRHYGWDIIGIQEGFDGLIGRLPTIDLHENDVHDLLARGGTILGTANRGNPFARPVEQHDGTIQRVDVSQEAIDRIHELALDGLIVCGGDGTLSIGQKLVDLGAPIVGVPKTIDNDVAETDFTFGFNTAITTATEALEKLQTTAESHHRVMVLELMGRNAGWIALFAGIAGGADAILLPEIPFDINIICDKISHIKSEGRRYSLVVVAEGARPINGKQLFYNIGKQDNKRLGGIGYRVGDHLAECHDSEVRVTVLGHVQRGGQPTPRDRLLATGFGASAVHLIHEQKWGHMVALNGTEIITVLIKDAIKMKFVQPDSYWVQIARDLGIVFG